jgi:CubicO group peptidase (beta-lactamase class C family)
MRIVLWLVCLLASSVPANAQVALPDTPAGHSLSAWLDALNAGDREGLQRALNRDLTPRNRRTVEDELLLRQNTGGFEVRRVDVSSLTRVEGIVQERDSERFLHFTIEVEPDAPHRFTAFRFVLIPPPAEFAPPRLGEADFVRALEAEVKKRAAADQFSGTVLVARRDKIIFQYAGGLADRERGIANQPNTRFRNGSMNKMFTAVAILQLVQAGKVSLDAPIGRYLSDYPNTRVASRVTIHHLLTHTGGTGDIFGPQFVEHRLRLRTHADYLALYGSRDLALEPGRRWQYSNYGYVLLGAIIERVTGMEYYEYLRTHVYLPAGMVSTGSDPEERDIARLAHGYMRRRDAAGWHLNTDTLPYRGTAAGGGYTTVADLLRFATALRRHTLLDPRHTALLTSGKVQGGPQQYAYGFGDVTVNGVRWVGHNGGAAGMNGDLRIFPDSGYVVAVLANLDPPAADRLSEFASVRLPAN